MTDAQIAVTNQVLATCWTCMLLSAFVCEPVLSKGGRGGSRGSSRGTSTTAGSYRGGRTYGGTRSRFRVSGRASPVRVTGAAAAGVAVALTEDKWYASAFRRSTADSSHEDTDFCNMTCYFKANTSGGNANGPFLGQVIWLTISLLYLVY